MPKPYKPNHLKAVAGTDRPDRHRTEIDAPPVLEMPAIPDWLDQPDAKAEFLKLATICMANKILTQANVMPLAVGCALLGQIIEAYREKEPPKAATLAEYFRFCGQFGMTPASASKVNAAPEKPKAGKFDGIGRGT